MKSGIVSGAVFRGLKTSASKAHAPARLIPDKHLGTVAVLFGLLMFLCGVALDMLLLHEHEGRILTITVSDALAGLIAGVLIYKLLCYARERRRRVEQRLQTISDMNHHIRNALQVISFSLHTSKNQKEIDEITEAVNRIQWALREILPRLEPSFEPFEGRARSQLSTDKSSQ